MDFHNLFNGFGVLFAVLLVLPHVVFVKTKSYDKTVFTNKGMVYIDRIGRFFSVLLMAINIGVLEKGFTEPKELMERFWLITTATLIAVYLLMWVLFYRSGKKAFAYSIIFSSAIAVIFTGICQVKTLLFTAGIVYLIGELYMASRFFSKTNS